MNDRNGMICQGQPENATSVVCPLQSPIALTDGPAASAVDEAIIASLEKSGAYRVLRRLQPPRPIELQDDAAVLIAIDLETTGLDPQTDEIIEVGIARVRYDMVAGRMLGVEGTFSALREPSKPISEPASRLTGLTSDDLSGRTIDPDDIACFCEGARLVVAHGAGFDRRFCEKTWPFFSNMAWADSCTQADWSLHGYEGAKLGHLVLQSGYFHHGHRALDDVMALLHVLGRETSLGTPFRSLLANARAPSSRMWADNAPFASRNILKARGYRWSSGENGAPRAWYRDVPTFDVDAEVAFLREEAGLGAAAFPRIVQVSAFDRFTDRAGLPTAPQQ
jgi:DNA polymerase III subunit epsilon